MQDNVDNICLILSVSWPFEEVVMDMSGYEREQAQRDLPPLPYRRRGTLHQSQTLRSLSLTVASMPWNSIDIYMAYQWVFVVEIRKATYTHP